MRKLLLSFFLFWGVVLASPAAAGQTIYVDDDGPGDYNRIQDAIDAARNGDIVIVAVGRYTGPGNVNLISEAKT